MRLQERNSEHMYLFSLHRNKSMDAPASAGHFLQWTPVGNPREVAGYIQLCDVARARLLAPFKVLVQLHRSATESVKSSGGLVSICLVALTEEDARAMTRAVAVLSASDQQ